MRGCCCVRNCGVPLIRRARNKKKRKRKNDCGCNYKNTKELLSAMEPRGFKGYQRSQSLMDRGLAPLTVVSGATPMTAPPLMGQQSDRGQPTSPSVLQQSYSSSPKDCWPTQFVQHQPPVPERRSAFRRRVSPVSYSSSSLVSFILST